MTLPTSSGVTFACAVSTKASAWHWYNTAIDIPTLFIQKKCPYLSSLQLHVEKSVATSDNALSQLWNSGEY